MKRTKKEVMFTEHIIECLICGEEIEVDIETHIMVCDQCKENMALIKDLREFFKERTLYFS
jgi:Zn finger protein HypA/HybF involved in hydrogenase expression